MRLNTETPFEEDGWTTDYKDLLEWIIKKHKNGIKPSILDMDKAINFFENEYKL